MWGALAAAFVLGSSSAPATQPSRIVFASARTTVSQLYSVEPSGRGLAQLTSGAGGWGQPVPSPDGRFVAALRGRDLWLMRPDGRHPRHVAANVSGGFSWSPNSRLLAFGRAGAIWTTAVDRRPRQVTHGHDDSRPSLSPDGRSVAFLRATAKSTALVVRRRGREMVVLNAESSAPAWSPDGKWIAVGAERGAVLELVRPTGGAPRVLVFGFTCGGCAYPKVVWSPDGRRLVYSDVDGLEVVQRSRRGARLLVAGLAQDLAWSPRGTAVAFRTDAGIRIVTLHRRVRTLVPFGPYEAQPGLGWSPAASGVSYQIPEETPVLARVSPRELEARFPIRQLSADGDRVAYWLCPHVLGAWHPGDGQPVSLGGANLVACRPPAGQAYGNDVYDLALAGDRLAYATVVSANEIHTALMLTTLARGTEGDQIADGAAGQELPLALGDAVGAGSTLVYGFRESQVTSAHPAPEEIWRIDGAKPVQITHDAEDLQPLSVDQGRIVARRPDGSLWLLDSDGRVLRTFDVPSIAAVLAGDDLVVLVRGELLDYSASTGEHRDVYSLPDVPSSGRCRLLSCPGIRLSLDDAARGVVVFTLHDGDVHLLRLRDGAEAEVRASAADLTDAGLFYAYTGEDPWPGRIRFVPFDELPF